MRIAVITDTRAKVGGVETYLERVIPALSRDHEIGFWSASAEANDRGAIALPDSVCILTHDSNGGDPLAGLRNWRPDVLFAHGLWNVAQERRIFDITPAVLVQHTYQGTCITSAKTMSWPHTAPCQRKFGPSCVAMYYPRRCGGLNPATMIQLYSTQTARKRLLDRAAAIVTFSTHMAEEVRRNGVAANRVHVIRPFVTSAVDGVLPKRPRNERCELLFIGRIERLKGVDRLLDAAHIVVRTLGRRVRLVVAGDGQCRHELQEKARQLCSVGSGLTIEFPGWQDEAGMQRLLAQADALVVPSLWPEPFGLVGLEAAAAGVPSVAYRAGGIPEWLHDGVNGCLVSGEHGSAEALARAIVRCVGSPERLARFRTGAREIAAHWTLNDHVTRLNDVFNRVRTQ